MAPFLDPELRAAATAASLPAHERWWATAPRCCALNRFGEPCKAVPLRGGDRCAAHAGKRPSRRQDSPLKAHRRDLARTWRRDPWVPGFTVLLPPVVERELATALSAEGIRVDWLAPACADWVRWRFLRLQQYGESAGRWPAIVDGLRERDREAGEPPETSPVDHTAWSVEWVPVASIKPRPGTRWTRAGKGRGGNASPEAIEAAASDRLARYEGDVVEWRPGLGGPLTAWERQQLELAREKDLREGHGGHRLEEFARRAIEGGRVQRERDAEAARERELELLRAQLRSTRPREGTEVRPSAQPPWKGGVLPPDRGGW